MSVSTPDTIVALSSGAVPSGIAVVRVSGSQCEDILRVSLSSIPEPRLASLKGITDRSGNLIDEGVVLWFPGPASFTGEDSAEFHIHGGRAVVSALINHVCDFENVRIAEAGEFSRRAFENGKADLTEIDGISDLIASETEAQRRLALSQSQGSLRELYEVYRDRIVFIRAMLEAEFDFSDEEDVPEEISEEGLSSLSQLIKDIEEHLDDNRVGEIVRDGYKVALMGKPNVGKSSLLNLLSQRDVAIVTDKEGTTRDILQVDVDLIGHKITLFDTAGIRETVDPVEVEGIRRARLTADNCDLILWLHDDDTASAESFSGDTEIVPVRTKIDLGAEYSDHGISCVTGEGLKELLDFLGDKVGNVTSGIRDCSGIITRRRYRDGLVKCLSHLENALRSGATGLELRAEEVRMAGVELGRISGKVDVEDLLDVIFSQFCVGK